MALSQSLTERGVDVIDCSSGGITGDSDMAALSYAPGYQVGFAERIRRDAQTRTMAVGLLTDPRHVESILEAGQADLIAMARELMYHGDWPVHAARTLGVPEYLDLFPADYAWRLKRRVRGQGFTL